MHRPRHVSGREDERSPVAWMGVSKTRLATLALCALLIAAGQGPVESDSTAFVHVNVVPMDRERVLEDYTVVVHGDRIVALGPAESTPVPAHTRRIEGAGRYLIPGLADMHVHLFEESDLLLYLANGVTTIRNLGGYGAADTVLALRDRIESGKLLGPQIFTSGNWLDGAPPVREINTVVTTAEAARREVAAEARAGYDFVKVYNNLSAEAYWAIVDEARRRGIPVTGHIPGSVGLDGVLEAGQVEIAHAGPMLWAVGWDADSLAMARAAAWIAEAGIAVTATLSMSELGIRQSGNTAEIARVAERPENRYVPPSRRAFWRDENMFAGMPRRPEPRARLATLRSFVGALRRAGVRVLAGTDADVGGQIPGFSIHDELRNLVAAGFTPYDALRSATADAYLFLADVLQDARPFGTIDVGSRADLLLLEANPLDDVANVRRRAGVMVAGRWLPESELESRLEAIAGSYRD